MVGNFRYTGINLCGWIQEVVMNGKIHFVCFLKKLFKYNVKTEYCVGHLQLRSLDTDVFFKMTPVFDDIQASVTGNTIKQ